MTIIDPNTGLLITCEPWEYAELCKQHGWIKTTYKTNTVPSQKDNFIPPGERGELEWVKKAKEEE